MVIRPIRSIPARVGLNKRSHARERIPPRPNGMARLYRVIAANSGVRALRMAFVFPMPDLILLDATLPGMDGYAVATSIPTWSMPSWARSICSRLSPEATRIKIEASPAANKPPPRGR